MIRAMTSLRSQPVRPYRAYFPWVAGKLATQVQTQKFAKELSGSVIYRNNITTISPFVPGYPRRSRKRAPSAQAALGELMICE